MTTRPCGLRRAGNHHYQQTNTQLITGRMPFLSSNSVKALKGKEICKHTSQIMANKKHKQRVKHPKKIYKAHHMLNTVNMKQ